MHAHTPTHACTQMPTHACTHTHTHTQYGFVFRILTKGRDYVFNAISHAKRVCAFVVSVCAKRRPTLVAFDFQTPHPLSPCGKGAWKWEVYFLTGLILIGGVWVSPTLVGLLCTCVRTYACLQSLAVHFKCAHFTTIECLRTLQNQRSREWEWRLVLSVAPSEPQTLQSKGPAVCTKCSVGETGSHDGSSWITHGELLLVFVSYFNYRPWQKRQAAHIW